MPTIQIYIPEGANGRLIRAAEAKAITGSKLAAEILEKIFTLDNTGQRLRRWLAVEL